MYAIRSYYALGAPQPGAPAHVGDLGGAVQREALAAGDGGIEIGAEPLAVNVDRRPVESPQELASGGIHHVITSYSIHYTKLYD